MKASASQKPPLRLEWRSPAELEDNPSNWRRHPEAQSVGLEAVLREVGWAGALLFNETTGRLVDGHARKKLPESVQVDGKVPVLVGSWTEDQERVILATLDPLAAMAEADQLALIDLLEATESEDAGVAALLESIGAKEAGMLPAPNAPEEFPEVGEGLATDHECPQCGYRWSGGT